MPPKESEFVPFVFWAGFWMGFRAGDRPLVRGVGILEIRPFVPTYLDVVRFLLEAAFFSKSKVGLFQDQTERVE